MDISLLKQIHFLRPEWLLLFLPYIYIFYNKFKKSNDDKMAGKQFPPHLMKALNINKKTWKSNLPLKIMAIIIAVAIIVASGVSWKRTPSPFGEDKSNLIIVLDASESMLETDLAPSRLERSKQKINDLLKIRNGGRAALVVYSGSAHTVMPLTEDIEVFKPFLEAVSPKIMPKKGKFAEDALEEVDKIQADYTLPSTVLLVTDGLGGNTLSSFNQYFENSKNQLIVWGAGNDKNPSDIPFEESKLKNLASSNSGYYKQITVDDSDIGYILSKTESHMQINLDKAQPWEDSGYYLLFVIAGFYLLWFRRGWLIQWSVAGLLVCSISMPQQAMASEYSFTDLWLTKDQQGTIHYNNGEFLEAAKDFEDPFWIGMSYYEAQDYKKAHTYFMRVSNKESMIYGANSLAKSREYLAARSLYDELLKKYPEDEYLMFNRTLIQRLIDAVNLMSESQANTEQEVSKELGDQPQTGEGADEEVAKQQLIVEKLTAEQLLQDEELNKKWMERVQSNPSRFLFNKFNKQLQNKENNK